jgi:transposase
MRQQKSAVEFGFNRYDKARLHKAMERVSDKRTYLRLKAVLLVAHGMNINEVSQLLDKSFQIIYQWINSYIAHHDPQALYDASRSGRPLTAPSITNQRILKELNRNPLLLGYNTTVWTVALLGTHLNDKYQCNISSFTLYRRMKAMGLRCKRPRYVYSEKDPHRAQKKGQSSES